MHSSYYLLRAAYSGASYQTQTGFISLEG